MISRFGDLLLESHNSVMAKLHFYAVGVRQRWKCNSSKIFWGFSFVITS